jgi:hypothetical protein
MDFDSFKLEEAIQTFKQVAVINFSYLMTIDYCLVGQNRSKYNTCKTMVITLMKVFV